MYIDKLSFKWENPIKDTIDVGNICSVEITFDRANENPLLTIDAGKIKVEDRSLEINSEEILKNASKVDFENIKKYESNEYCGDYWQLVVNDKKYGGILDNPRYVNEIRRIIRLNAILLYANKKIGNYYK